MNWAAALSGLDAAVFGTFGESATFTAPGGAAIPVGAVLDHQTVVQGDLGQVLDLRPSVSLRRSEIGTAARGTITINGRAWVLDQLIEDDGQVVRFYVK